MAATPAAKHGKTLADTHFLSDSKGSGSGGVGGIRIGKVAFHGWNTIPWGTAPQGFRGMEWNCVNIVGTL